ncbi:roadblock/LC7 domain-containing protein [Streptomyces sp. NPDC086023]|uniref:roadblock/LC7 domain-containing protein n=1 Tax=Streptomyces sp. NPDC086023 TaxID=3365746 RepID=UPI0037CED0CF
MTTRNAQLATEMRELRDRVVGVTDVVVASVDGLLITAETDDTADAESLAALTAAAVSLAHRAGAMTGKGLLHHSVSRFTDGYLVAHPVGDMALIGVLGDPGLDIRRLQSETQATLPRLTTLLTTPDAPKGP